MNTSVRTVPNPYCRPLPEGWISLSAADVIRQAIGNLVHGKTLGQLSAWTHGKKYDIRWRDEVDPEAGARAVHDALCASFGEYPFNIQQGIDPESEERVVLITWHDPDAPGATTYEAFRGVMA